MDELKPGELRVYYKTEVGEIDLGLDMAIEKLLAARGYHRWASGFDLATDVRDIAFDRDLK